MNRRITVLTLLFTLLAALLIAGCGSSSSDESSTSTSSDVPTDVPEFADIAPDVSSAMEGATSASFKVDLTADVTAAEGSQLDAFTQDDINVNISGAASENAADVNINATGAGKEFALELLGDQTSSYLKFKDVWYDIGEPLNADVPSVPELPEGSAPSGSQTTTTTPDVSTQTPEEIQSQLDQYGISVEGAGATNSDGAAVYKYTFTFTDAQSLATAISSQDPTTTPAEARAIAAVLTSPGFEMTASIYPDSNELAGVSFSMTISKDQIAQLSGGDTAELDQSGFESLDLSVTAEFSNWNQPVTVEKPSGDIKSIDELQQALMPELMGLAQGATTPPTQVTPPSSSGGSTPPDMTVPDDLPPGVTVPDDLPPGVTIPEGATQPGS